MTISCCYRDGDGGDGGTDGDVNSGDADDSDIDDEDVVVVDIDDHNVVQYMKGVKPCLSNNSQLGNGVFWFIDYSDKPYTYIHITTETYRRLCHSQMTVYQECAVKDTSDRRLSFVLLALLQDWQIPCCPLLP